MTATLMVSYPARDGARFDRHYYRGVHLPLVQARWGEHGLIEAVAYFPDEPGDLLAIAMFTFRDASARTAALTSEEAAEVFGDIGNFTDVAPTPLALSPAHA